MKLRDLDKFDDILDEHFSNDTGIKSGVKQMGRAKPEAQRKLISEAMRGKTLEELVGEEAAQRGRQARSQAARGPRPPEVMQKIAATRRAKGNYGKSMLGAEHKESTKKIMSLKAKIRQDLKRELGLGRNESIPKDILLAEYNKRGLL